MQTNVAFCGRSRRPSSSILCAFVLLLVSVRFIGGCENRQAGGASRGEPPPVTVQAVTVEPTEISRTLPAVGTLKSPQSTELAAEFGGKVVFLDIPEGQEVAAGHILARIDDRQAKAAVDIAQARYRNANERLARLRKLRSQRLISQQELDDATAELEAAEGSLADARTALRKTAIHAPFSGVLGFRQVSLGAYLEPGDPVVRLTQSAPLELVFSLPQRHVSELQVGQTVRGVVGSCAQRFVASVSVIDPNVDVSTRMVRVQALVPNEDRRLLPGMSALLKLEVQKVADALLVPQEAVVRQGTKRLIYSVEEGGSVSSHEVVLGEFFSDRVQVVGGLEPGTVVVASGHQKLRPGTKAVAEPYQPIENPNLELGSSGKLAECDF